MTYNIFIDQKFAIVHGLTIVQTTTLAACMTLTSWSNSIKLGNVVWYQYSEKEMSDNFPLLFSIPKRAYKNLRILSDMGFVELISISETKYLRFTSKCTNWKCQDGNYFVIFYVR